MKKIILVLLTACLITGTAAGGALAMAASLSSSAAAEPGIVTFIDPVLEAMVCGAMGKPKDTITLAEAQSVTRMNLSNEWQRYLSDEAAIHGIGGLEAFVNLESLDLSFNEVTDISPLRGLKKLTSLSLGGNPVHDIAPLAELTNLKALILSGCKAQDYSPLSKLSNLQLLKLDNAAITDVSPLIPLKNLRYLWLAGCPVSDYFPLSDLYQRLEQKDFTIPFTLAELGFTLDSNGKQAIYDGESASVRINHLQWGDPPEDWFENCVRTVFAQNDYKIDIGYYPDSDTYGIMAFKNGNPALSYGYNHANDSFTFNKGDRKSSEKAVRAMLPDTDAQDILLLPIQTYHDILALTVGVSADTLFEMPFDEADDTLPSAYEKLGFTLLDYKGTCFYEERAPHDLNISVHRTEWDENAPAENRVDWSMEFYDSNVNGYALLILYYADEGRYHVELSNKGAKAAMDVQPATGDRGGEWPDLDTAHRLFNDAFGTKGKELYDKPIAYFEQAVQERFGMSIDGLYALPAGK